MFKKLFNNEAGVSPIVATLVLVVVAIAGAAAVGTIMGSFSSDVSSQANAENAMGSSATEILIAGSTTVQPVSELIAKDYMDKNTGIKVTVQAGGSDAGIASAGMGIVDIGSASKFMDTTAQTKYPDLEEHVIGGSAVTVIVNDAFPAVYNVSKAELLAIYDDVPDASISINGTNITGAVAYQRTEGSGTEETFAEYVTSKARKNVDNAVDNTGVTQANAIGNQGVLDAVKGSTAPAIGFVDYGFAADVTGVKILNIESYPTVSKDNIKAAVKERLADAGSSTTYEYSLCRPLVYLTNGQPSSLVNNYIQYAMSPAALDCFHDAGYFGITELA